MAEVFTGTSIYMPTITILATTMTAGITLNQCSHKKEREFQLPVLVHGDRPIAS